MFETGRKIGPYVLERRLGEGSYGVVWLAGERTGLIERQVALKLPKDAEPDLEAIRREAAVWLSAGKHANVVQVLHADIYGDQVAIATEYIAGGSLQDRLRREPGGILSPSVAVEMTRGILAGLQHLHALHPKPLIHRDLKPGNVLLRGDTPLLTDFGLTRAFSSTVLTQAGGTPGYMPPEAFDDRFSPQTDIWAAGVTLYRMLKGELPFPQRDLAALVGAILGREPEPLPDSAPRPIVAVIFKAMMKDPDHRFGSATEMLAALDAAMRDGAASITVPATLLQPIPPVPGTIPLADFDIRTPSGSGDPLARTRGAGSSSGAQDAPPQVPELGGIYPAGPARPVAMPGYGAPDPPQLDMPALPVPTASPPGFGVPNPARSDTGGAPPHLRAPGFAAPQPVRLDPGAAATALPAFGAGLLRDRQGVATPATPYSQNAGGPEPLGAGSALAGPPAGALEGTPDGRRAGRQQGIMARPNGDALDGASGLYSEALTAVPERTVRLQSLGERLDGLLAYLAADTTRFCCALIGSAPVAGMLATIARLLERAQILGTVSALLFTGGLMSVVFARLAWHRYAWKPERARRAAAIRYAILGCFSGAVIPVVAVALYVAISAATGARSEMPPRDGQDTAPPP